MLRPLTYVWYCQLGEAVWRPFLAASPTEILDTFGVILARITHTHPETTWKRGESLELRLESGRWPGSRRWGYPQTVMAWPTPLKPAKILEEVDEQACSLLMRAHRDGWALWL